jgi:hypothetical protein
MASKKDERGLKPLRRFDFGLVLERMDGALINVDRDLQRLVKQAEAMKDAKNARKLVLFVVLTRFAKNSFMSVRYLCADTPDDSKRKFNFALAVPTINRQLLDLLFSVVYMFDDINVRSDEYERAGWREAYEQYQKEKTAFSKDPEWKPYFKILRESLSSMAKELRITSQQQGNPKLIPYWKHPYELQEEQTASRPFLRYLNKWIYHDTSAQAHLSCGGLIMMSPFLLAELVGGQKQEMIENRAIQQYRYLHISRTAIVTLAIASEMDAYFGLNNAEQLKYIWNVFAEYSEEAKEMLEHRYESLWNLRLAENLPSKKN